MCFVDEVRVEKVTIEKKTGQSTKLCEGEEKTKKKAGAEKKGKNVTECEKNRDCVRSGGKTNKREEEEKIREGGKRKKRFLRKNEQNGEEKEGF